MITIVACPKAFRGAADLIQRNAILSWSRLPIEKEIILVCDDPGVAEVASSIGAAHIPDVLRNSRGTPRVDDIISLGQQFAGYSLVCFINSDVILMHDFAEAVRRITGFAGQFLMVGRRCDLAVNDAIDFTSSWEDSLRGLAARKGVMKPDTWIDYFVFRKGLFDRIPAFAVGRPGYDNWLLWYAAKRGAAIADASRVVLAVQQEHDYSHIPDTGVSHWHGPEAADNSAHLGGRSHMYTIAHAAYELTPSGLRRSRRTAHFEAVAASWRNRLVDDTRPIRHRLGIRQGAVGRLVSSLTGRG